MMVSSVKEAVRPVICVFLLMVMRFEVIIVIFLYKVRQIISAFHNYQKCYTSFNIMADTQVTEDLLSLLAPGKMMTATIGFYRSY